MITLSGMDILSITIIAFILLELGNVLTLYFIPSLKQSNGIGIFNAWERSKQDAEMHDFVKYLTLWVAGSKLIFIGLLLVVLVFADPITKWWAGIAVVLSIPVFYLRMFPIVRSMSRKSQISPRWYSTYLGFVILGFTAAFVISLVLTYPY